MKRNRSVPLHFNGISAGTGVLIASSSEMPYQLAKRFRKNISNAVRMIQSAWRRYTRALGLGMLLGP
jgi:hypothetical protein